MDQYFISVIVIGYNIEQFVENCLSSLTKQTYNNYEVLFVDDGSTDSTLDVAKKIAEKYPIVKVISKKNGGIVSARIEGVKAAKGQYISFVDGDDWVNPDMLENLAQGIAFLDGEESDIIASSFYSQKQNGSFSIRTVKAEKEFLAEDEYFQAIMTDKLAHYMFPRLYKRDFVLKAGYINYPHVTIAEDLMTNAFFGLYNPKVHIIDSVNYYYRYNQSSCTRSNGKRLLDQITTLYYMEECLKANENWPEYQKLIEYQWFSFSLAYLANSDIDRGVKKEIVRKCAEKIDKSQDNEYIRNRMQNMGRTLRLACATYFHAPAMSWLYEIALKGVRMIYDAHK